MTSKGPAPTKEKVDDFYKELEHLLQKQLDANPESYDVRLKLLELYYEQHRSEEFLRAARTWFSRLKSSPAAERDWSRVASMGRMLIGSDPLFAARDGDKIEFIGAGASASPKEPEKIRRFGDEEHYQGVFSQLAEAYDSVRRDPKFTTELEMMLVSLATRRPTPLVHGRHISERNGGAQIYIKREDLAGEAPHLTAALTGQALLARRLGKNSLVIGTTDGRRAAIAGAVAARRGLKLVVYRDEDQAERQSASVLFTRLMGADLRMVKAHKYRNKDVREAALAHWHRLPGECFLLIGLDAAPPPYPFMTQEFTAAIGRETRRQFISAVRRAPDLVATRGTQSADALALFPAFLGETATRLACVEGDTGENDGRPDIARKGASQMTSGERKVMRRILDRLEYPSVAREHAMFKASGRVEYVHAQRPAVREALLQVARCEGLVLAIDSAHLFAWALAQARTMKPEQAVLVVLSESPDKDAWDISQLVDEPQPGVRPGPGERS